jgi:hypothetical protein
MADKGNKVPKGFDLPDYLIPIAPVQNADGSDRKPNLIYVCHKNTPDREEVFVYKKKYGAYVRQYSRHDTPATFHNDETPGEARWDRDWNRRNLTYNVSTFLENNLPTPEMVKAAYAGEGYYSIVEVEEAEKEEEAPKRGKTMGSLFSAKMEERILEAVSMSIAQDLAETVKPEVERHIIEVLGYKPQRHEIVTPTQEIVFEGVVHEKFDMVCNLVQNNIPIFLTGAAGTGKNHLVKDVARALGLNFYFTNAITSEYKLSGFIDANGRFHETAFYNAFSKGGIFFFDEVDASTPEALAYTHAAISNGYCDFPTGHVEAHPDFRVIAAGNTFGTGADLEYVGRFQLDAATLDRFALVNIDYSPEIESAMAMHEVCRVLPWYTANRQDEGHTFRRGSGKDLPH